MFRGVNIKKCCFGNKTGASYHSARYRQTSLTRLLNRSWITDEKLLQTTAQNFALFTNN